MGTTRRRVREVRSGFDAWGATVFASVLAFLASSGLAPSVLAGARGVSCCLPVLIQDEDNQDTDPKKDDATDGDPVVQSTGNLRIQETDMTVLGRGMNVEITRTYRNGTKVPTALGPGWDLNWLKRIVVHYYQPVSGVCLTTGLDLESIYYYDGATRIDYLSIDQPHPLGLSADLPMGQFGKVIAIDATPTDFYPSEIQIRMKDGMVYRFLGGDFGGSLASCTQTYWLSEVRDADGNSITCNYETVGTHKRLISIEDTYDRVITFAYDSNDMLESVTDFAGRTVQYAYENGQLAEVRSPVVTGTSTGNDFPNGRITRYEYDGTFPQNIVQVIAPEEYAASTPYLQNTYSSDGRRVVAQLNGGTNASGVEAGGRYVFVYDRPSQPVDHGWFLESGKTLSISPNGNVTLRVFDESGSDVLQYQYTGRLNPEHSMFADPEALTVTSLVDYDVSSQAAAMDPQVNGLKFVAAFQSSFRPGIDPRSYITRKAFNAHALMVELEGPGVHELYIYDESSPDRFQQGNVLRIEQLPVPDDGSNPIVRTFAYEPLFNQVRASVDPRGNDPAFTPPNGGAASVARYLTETEFDYQEGDVSTTLDAYIEKWEIDLQQSSQFTVLPGIFAAIGSITADDEQGDLNADGVTNQTAGKKIVVRNPSAEVPTRASLASGSLAFETQPIVSTMSYNAYGLQTQSVDPSGNVTQFAYFESTDPTGQTAGAASASNGGLLARTDLPEGVVKSLGYDSLGRETSATNGRGFVTQREYNALGEHVATTDAVGNRIEYVYDANGNRVEVRIENERPALDSATGMPTGAQQSLGEIVHTFAFDILGKELTFDLQADFDGQAERVVTHHRYDKDGNRILTLSPRFVAGEQGQAVRSTTYDERGLVFAQSRGGLNLGFLFPAHSDVMADAQVSVLPLEPAPPADFSTRGFYYDARGNATSEFDGEGNLWVTEYDPFGRVLREYRPQVGGASQGHYDEYSWDPAGNRVDSASYESSAGGATLLAQTSKAHDEAGRVYETHRALDTLGLTFVTLVDGALTPGDGWVTERRLHDASGRATVAVDDNRHYEAFEYDGLGRITRTWDGAGDDLAGGGWTSPASVESVRAYDDSGNMIHEVTTEYREGGSSQSFDTWTFFDGLDRATATVDSLGHTERRLYDSRDNVVFESDARSASISTAYLTGLDGYSEHAVPPTMAINSHGNTATTSYDDLSRGRRVDRALRVGGTGDGAIDPSQAGDGWIRTELDYDGNGNVVARRDDKGSESTFDFDALDRQQQFVFSDGYGLQTTSYDRNDRLVQHVDALGSTTTVTYDASGRKTDVQVQRATGVVGTTWEHYDYDGLDRIVVASDNDSTVTIDYDSLSNRVREVQNGKTVLSPTNGLGQVTSITYPGGRTIERTYDSLNRLSEVIDTGTSNTLARSHYVGPYRLEHRELLPSGASALIDTTFAYDADRRVVETLHARNSDGLVVDHRTYQWDRADNKVLRVDVPAGVSHSYAYDSQDRLVQSVRSGSSADRTIDYQLDGVGNRVAVTGGAGSGSYTTGGTGYETNLYSFTPTERFFYDAKGSVESYNLFSLNPPSSGFPNDVKYDYMNRMVRHDSAAGVTTIFRYDVFGRRIEKKVDGVPNTYFYHGFHEVEERGPRGGTVATYVYSDRTDDVLSMTRGTNNYFYHADDMGNVMRVSNGTGAAIGTELYDYEDYGELVNGSTFGPRPNTSRIGNRMFFSGRRFDPETRFYYFRNRYLDPVTGRFTTRDPIGIWEDETNLGNGFTYAGNNPWSFRDRSGLEKEDEKTPKERRDEKIDEEKQRLKDLKEARDRGEISEKEYRTLRDQTRDLIAALQNAPSTMFSDPDFHDVATQFMDAADRLSNHLTNFTDMAKADSGPNAFQDGDDVSKLLDTWKKVDTLGEHIKALKSFAENFFDIMFDWPEPGSTHTHQPPSWYLMSYECEIATCGGGEAPAIRIDRVNVDLGAAALRGVPAGGWGKGVRFMGGQAGKGYGGLPPVFYGSGSYK